jgi:DNA-binding NtrC family response regulator
VGHYERGIVHKNFPTVFIVDDEKTIAETLAVILGMSGFAAHSFSDPREALKAAGGEIPDLLLSDVMMPELTGVDLAIAVQQSCPKCKVLLFSGQADTADLLSKAREQGHNFHLLAKPIHPSDLLRLIRQQDPAWAL